MKKIISNFIRIRESTLKFSNYTEIKNTFKFIYKGETFFFNLHIRRLKKIRNKNVTTWTMGGKITLVKREY